MDLGGGHLSMASVFFGSVDMPAAETIWPKNSTWNWNRWHFLGVTLRPACFNRLRTSCSRVRCSSKVSLKTIMWSKYIRQISQWRPERTSSISRSNVAGVLARPKGIFLNWYNPNWVVKAVFSASSGAIGTCQYPLARSKVENHLDPLKASIVSSIRGDW